MNPAPRVRARRLPAPPRTPVVFEDAQLPLHGFADGVVHSGMQYVGLELTHHSIVEHVEITRCKFSRASIHSVQLDSAAIVDSALSMCDVSNLRMVAPRLLRVDIDQCRITGLAFSNGSLRDVHMRECRGKFSSFRFSKLRDVRFAGCVLSGADFQNSKLENVEFQGCELDGAQFSGASLSNVRFSDCALTGIGGIRSLAGATVTENDLPGLALTLAEAMGIIVERREQSA